jgi:hypothetical protein
MTACKKSQQICEGAASAYGPPLGSNLSAASSSSCRSCWRPLLAMVGQFRAEPAAFFAWLAKVDPVLK